MSGQRKEADLTRRQGAGGPPVPPTTPANRKKSRVSWFGGQVEAKNLVGVALKDGQAKKLGVNCKLVGSVAKILPLVVSCCKVGGRWKNVIFNQKRIVTTRSSLFQGCGSSVILQPRKHSQEKIEKMFCKIVHHLPNLVKVLQF